MIRLLTILLSVIAMFGFNGVASAATWTATLHTLPSTMNTPNFRVEYSVLSTQTDSFTATLLQSTDGGADYVQCGPSQDTNADPNDFNGGSGTLPTCIGSDGNYSFKVIISRDNSEDSPRTFGPTSTHVTTGSLAAPTYGGKVQSDNNYTITFTAPSNSTVSHVKIFAATSTTYTANAATQIGDAEVTPGQTVHFDYTAPDSATRYFSVQAFDAAGNSSGLTGDPGSTVTPVTFVNGVVAAAQIAAATTAVSSGEVQGASTTAGNVGGQVNASGVSSTGKKPGKVLGAETSTTNVTSHKVWYYSGGAVVLALLAGFYWYSNRTKKTP